MSKKEKFKNDFVGKDQPKRSLDVRLDGGKVILFGRVGWIFLSPAKVKSVRMWLFLHR